MSLSEADLRTLASALRSGRLTLPSGEFALRRLIGPAHSGELSAELQAISQAGCSPVAMAEWIEMLARSVRMRDPVEHVVQLVTTAPDGISSVHRDTFVVVQDMLRRAKNRVLISSYSLYNGRDIFSHLAQKMAADRSLLVRVFLDGQDQSRQALLNAFAQHHWPVDLRVPELFVRMHEPHEAKPAVHHAKCVVIDSEELFITSANFTEAAQERNAEVGVLLRSSALALRTVQFFDSLVESGFCRRLDASNLRRNVVGARHLCFAGLFSGRDLPISFR